MPTPTATFTPTAMIAARLLENWPPMENDPSMAETAARALLCAKAFVRLAVNDDLVTLADAPDETDEERIRRLTEEARRAQEALAAALRGDT